MSSSPTETSFVSPDFNVRLVCIYGELKEVLVPRLASGSSVRSQTYNAQGSGRRRVGPQAQIIQRQSLQLLGTSYREILF
jgi:hypothetical protein